MVQTENLTAVGLGCDYPYYTAAYNSGQTGSTPAAAGSSTANYGTNYGHTNYGFATTPSQAPTANRKRSR